MPDKTIKTKKSIKLFVRIHESYRKVVAVCDIELLGKRFEQDNIQIDINKDFYGGEEMTKVNVMKFLKEKSAEDACFNFVGKNAVESAVESGIVDKNCVIKIQGVPHAMTLL